MSKYRDARAHTPAPSQRKERCQQMFKSVWKCVFLSLPHLNRSLRGIHIAKRIQKRNMKVVRYVTMVPD